MKSSQILNTLPQKDDTVTESQLSEDIKSVKYDLPNQNVIKADTERARFIPKDNQEAMQ